MPLAVNLYPLYNLLTVHIHAQGVQVLFVRYWPPAIKAVAMRFEIVMIYSSLISSGTTRRDAAFSGS